MAVWCDVLRQVECSREDDDEMRGNCDDLVGVVLQGTVECSALRDVSVLPQHKRRTVETNVPDETRARASPHTLLSIQPL